MIKHVGCNVKWMILKQPSGTILENFKHLAKPRGLEPKPSGPSQIFSPIPKPPSH